MRKPFTLPKSQWAPVATYAYAGFMQFGRGAVVLDIEKILKGRGDFKRYVPVADMKYENWPSLDVEVKAQTYDPDTEIIAVFLVQGGGTEARVLTMAPTPKECALDLAERMTGKRALPTDTPRITKPVDLGDYMPEYAGTTVYVWVNPPPDFMKRYFDLVAAVKPEGKDSAETNNRLGHKIVALQAELWSQNADATTHWTPEGVLKLADEEPKLYSWLIERSLEMIAAHRSGQPPSPTD